MSKTCYYLNILFLDHQNQIVPSDRAESVTQNVSVNVDPVAKQKYLGSEILNTTDIFFGYFDKK